MSRLKEERAKYIQEHPTLAILLVCPDSVITSICSSVKFISSASDMDIFCLRRDLKQRFFHVIISLINVLDNFTCKTKWKSETPRCLRKFDKSALPVDYFGQKKAWMTGDIMNTVLTKLNRRLSRSNRSILLLMDNAASRGSFVTPFSRRCCCIFLMSALESRTVCI